MPKASFWHCFALSFYAFWPPSLVYLLSSQASDMLCFKKQRNVLFSYVTISYSFWRFNMRFKETVEGGSLIVWLATYNLPCVPSLCVAA